MRPALALFAAPLLVACAPSQPITYTPPDASGLVSVRPFPGPADICQVIGENDLTMLTPAVFATRATAP